VKQSLMEAVSLLCNSCILLNHFIESRYLLKSFMQSVIITAIKNKNGDLPDAKITVQ